MKARIGLVVVLVSCAARTSHEPRWDAVAPVFEHTDTSLHELLELVEKDNGVPVTLNWACPQGRWGISYHQQKTRVVDGDETKKNTWLPIQRNVTRAPNGGCRFEDTVVGKPAMEEAADDMERRVLGVFAKGGPVNVLNATGELVRIDGVDRFRQQLEAASVPRAAAAAMANPELLFAIESEIVAFRGSFWNGAELDWDTWYNIPTDAALEEQGITSSFTFRVLGRTACEPDATAADCVAMEAHVNTVYPDHTVDRFLGSATNLFGAVAADVSLSDVVVQLSFEMIAETNGLHPRHIRHTKTMIGNGEVAIQPDGVSSSAVRFRTDDARMTSLRRAD